MKFFTGPASRGRAAAAALCLGALLGEGAAAQEPILLSYERNFVRSSLATKAGVLRDAATDDRAAEFMGEFYEFALKFALDNGELMRDDPDMISLVALAAAGAGQGGRKASADTLWKLFAVYRDSRSRVEALKALGILGKGSPVVVENLNQFLANQNSYFRSGLTADLPTLEACVGALAALGDSSSFPVLFSAMTAGYSAAISRGAAQALGVLTGDYKQFLLEVMRKNAPAEKLAAFELSADAARFSEAERGELAEAALTTALELTAGGDFSQSALSLRYDAVVALTGLRWTRASALAIRHYYQAQADYEEGRVVKERFLQAIACLGAMGDSEAAQTLALQLGYANSQTERNGAYDEAVILALINAAGEIGDKVAFDYLLYVSYLNYAAPVQNAARDALSRLKW